MKKRISRCRQSLPPMKRTFQVRPQLLHCFINALVIRGLACLLLLLIVLTSTEVTAQVSSVPRGEQRVAMERDLSFTVAPPWQLVGDRRNWVSELQITNDAGLLVARAVINRENQKTAELARQRLLVTAGPAQQEGELFLFQGGPRTAARPAKGCTIGRAS